MVDFTTVEQNALSTLGAANSRRYNKATNPAGLSGDGYEVNFAPDCNAVATVAGAVKKQADAAQQAAAQAAGVAVNAPQTLSDTTATIVGSGNVVFHAQSDLLLSAPFRPTMWVKAVSATDAGKYMWGTIPAGGINFTTRNITLAVSQQGGLGSSVSDFFLIATGPAGPASGISKLQDDGDAKLGSDLKTNTHDILVQTGDAIIFDSAAAGIDMARSPIKQATIQNYGEKLQALGNISNTVTFDITGGNHFTGTLAGNITPVLPSGLPSGVKIALTFRIKQPAGQSYTYTAPGNVTHVGAAPVAPASGKSSEFIYDTIDGGTTYVGRTSFVNLTL